MAKKTVLKERKYKAGYVVRHELVDGAEFSMDDFTMKSAYTPSGDYIGSPKTAHRLCVKYGIKPEVAPPPSTECGPGNVCSIGFSEREGKWYGWSHRAIFGFKPGDKVKEGDCVASSGWTDEWIAEHPEDDRRLPVGFVAKDKADARRMAIAFAESVG
jgi:hypothetical protein